MGWEGRGGKGRVEEFVTQASVPLQKPSPQNLNTARLDTGGSTPLRPTEQDATKVQQMPTPRLSVLL